MDVRAVNGRGCTALHEAAAGGLAGVCSQILDRDRGAAELRNAQFRTALDLAVLHNHAQVAEVLRRAP